MFNKNLFISIILFFLFISSPFCQDKYDSEWKKVDSLKTYGYLKSALSVVNKIYDKSKVENEYGSFIKAVIYKLYFEQVQEENEVFYAIKKLKEEIKNSQSPLKNILHSMLADVYWSYYTVNRYKILNRSEVVNANDNDVQTWDLSKFVKEVTANYFESLDSTELLQSIKIDFLEPVLVKFKEDKNLVSRRKFRPTLYDFLAHRAVDFFTNTESNLTKPAEHFNLNNPSFFLPAAEFVNTPVKNYNDNSFDYYALTLIRDIIKFHINDTIPEALIDVDLKRFDFIYSNSNLDYKDSLYLNALKYLEEKYSSLNYSAEISYRIALHYYNNIESYEPLKSEDHKWDIKISYDKCKQTLNDYPNSIVQASCLNLIKEIEKKNLKLTFQSINIPLKPFLGLIEYKNIKSLKFRIIKTSTSEISEIKPDEDKKNESYITNIIKYYITLKPDYEFSVSLPDDGDFQTHKTEVKMPALPIGEYIILAGTADNPSDKNESFAYNFITISNISCLTKQLPNSEIEFQILNRESSVPLANADVELTYSKYNYKKEKYEQKYGGSYNTDKNGHFNVGICDKCPGNFFLEISYKNDYLNTYSTARKYENYSDYYNTYSGTFSNNSKYDESRFNDTINYVNFFTDRAIYRPGQTIYFKGILCTYFDNNNKIIPGKSAEVELYAYQKLISTIKATSNEYGTFSGSFIAPASGLNGEIKIKCKNFKGEIRVRIEEYKRPKFDVFINDIKGEFRLGDDIQVTGGAKSYSGANVDNAKVVYSIKRKTNYFNWWYNEYNKTTEISDTTITTDSSGNFKINFKAFPDSTVSKKANPYFTFEINADITDINGETHSVSKSINIGYVSLFLDVIIPRNIEKSDKKIFDIFTTNLNWQKEYVDCSIEIYKLKTPGEVLCNRKWEKPDKFLYSKEEFKKYFPNNIYNDEDDYLKWEKETKVKELKINSGIDSLLDLSEISGWNQGVYRLEISAKDKTGEEVKNFRIFSVYSTGEKTLPEVLPLWFQITKRECEPGEYSGIVVGSSYNNFHVLLEIEKLGKIIYSEYITLNNEQKYIPIYIKEEYRGDINVVLSSVRDNRSYSFYDGIYVPYTNKMLDISFETFRNKLHPGEEEEWSLKVKGKNSEKVAAEMVATLYDASLDVFKQGNWEFNLYKDYNYTYAWNSGNSFSDIISVNYIKYEDKLKEFRYYFDILNWFGLINESGYYNAKYSDFFNGTIEINAERKGIDVEQSGRIITNYGIRGVTNVISKTSGVVQDERGGMLNIKGGRSGENVIIVDGVETTNPLEIIDPLKGKLSSVSTRRNFNETAFFYPHLVTNENGEIIIKLKIPESLTKWKMLGFAHTKDLMYGSISNQLITQKELMITSNVPRFLREGDKITISSKITNLTDNDLDGNAQLMLFDAFSMKPVNGIMENYDSIKNFNTPKGRSTAVSWKITIPGDIEAVTYRVVASADNFSDGEENTIPVLSNNVLVTESIPLSVRSNETKNFKFDKFINYESPTAKNYKLTLEFASNPAWYALQSLPYLMEYPYECAEQVFDRFYANSVATIIINSNEKIKKVFDTWKNYEPGALMSNLEKNQELKSLLLEETPWVWNAKDENERKNKIALLFDINKMSQEFDLAKYKLSKMQLYSGGFPWFDKMPEDRYITQYIVTGLGRLKHSKINNPKPDELLDEMSNDAIRYLDGKISEDFKNLQIEDKQGYSKLSGDHLGPLQIQYLYSRSYFTDIQIDDKEAFDYYLEQAKKYWYLKGRFQKGMIALALHRYQEKEVPVAIIKSLLETAINSDEHGMYWKESELRGYFWYEAPIETHVLMIEVFDEVAKDYKAVDNLKIWLLKQKQTQDWKTTKATTDACFALLMNGADWLATESAVDITLGTIKVNPNLIPDVKVEAGSGYFKTSWLNSDITKEMGNITVSKKDSGISWGALYWQYFEQLDKITGAETNIKIDKKLFLEQNTSTGPVISLIDENTRLQVGDLIKVRIEIRVDRDMEYVHMKDMRASGFEPIDVLSEYKYQDGLGYFETTRDASTNFFFSLLPKGTYVFEYPLRANNSGDFSNGITTIQCMYAPDFSSHSEGIRVKIE
jgi:uncharacterized protein YfaS (alpha-2-macroglobulin family)